MIEITNLTKTKIDTKFLQKAAQAAFAVLRAEKDVSLVFIGDAKIKTLNKKYRAKNKTTDVLSFEELNEIFVCVPQAKRQAKVLKTGLKPELTRLLVHGIVHLAGFDHEKSVREELRMFGVEKNILDKINKNKTKKGF
ncbi:MAG TPA: rRNA maturation RNase YbeY [Candidatus Portnoybacteria bacterium]|nr:rRNA maturation RNase YbeY [Candidatus Portnoybacteria bacterium]